jgi:VWFA-related protein
MSLSRISASAISLAILFSASVLLQLQGQTPPPQAPSPTIKSEVRIALVDIVVTEGNGKSVGGLQKGDFQVAEDGRPQTISFFEEHRVAAAKPVSLPPMPPDMFTNYPMIPTTDSVNVLLLDSLNTQAIDQTYVRPQMEKYLQAAMNAPTGARIAIFTLGSKLRMVRGFTDDSSKLQVALMDPKSGTAAKFENQLASPSRIATENGLCGGIAPIAVLACKEYLADMRGERDGDRVAMTLQAFQALARYLAPIPGRKNVMWVAGSFPIHFFPDTGKRARFSNPYENNVQQTADLLTADQVAVYPILASGLDADDTKDPNNYGRPVEANAADRGFNLIAMETLARDTGGKAFYNTNGLSEAMAKAVDYGSHFYTLTYTPTNTNMDGKYRHIEIKTDNGYKLAYHRGYYAENAKFTPTDPDHGKSDQFAPLMGFGMPDFSQILFKVRVAPVPSKEPPKASGAKDVAARYGLDFAITPTDLRLQKSTDGVWRGNIEVMLVVYDESGKALNLFRRKSEIVLDQQLYAEVMRAGLQMHREIDVPPAGAVLRAGVYDPNSGKSGTMGIWLASSATTK